MAETIVCPACRAENAATACRRCRADLTLLIALERRRAQAIRGAAQALLLHDGYRAANLLRLAKDLRPGEDLTRLTGWARLMEGDYEEALQAWREAQKGERQD